MSRRQKGTLQTEKEQQTTDELLQSCLPLIGSPNRAVAHLFFLHAHGAACGTAALSLTFVALCIFEFRKYSTDGRDTETLFTFISQ